jgi:hypothetical protein
MSKHFLTAINSIKVHQKDGVRDFKMTLFRVDSGIIPPAYKSVQPHFSFLWELLHELLWDRNDPHNPYLPSPYDRHWLPASKYKSTKVS